MGIADKAIRFFFNHSNAVRNKIVSLAVDHLKNNRGDFEYFLKDVFLKKADRFPSLLNNGYLHINRASHLARSFKFPSDNLIIDVGAAAGATSVLFAKAFPFSIIYAFEPIHDTYQNLKKETAVYPAIHAINKALGNEIKSMVIHLASRITSSSLLNIEKEITNEFWKTHLKEEGAISVDMSKMDDEIPTGKVVSILKIDVQGYELEVLKGGLNTLTRTAIVLVEMQNHELYVGAPHYFEIDEHLRKADFVLFDIIPSIRQENKIYEWDAIYVNNKYAR